MVEDLEREYMDPSRGSVIEFTAGRFTYEVNLEGRQISDVIQYGVGTVQLKYWSKNRFTEH